MAGIAKPAAIEAFQANMADAHRLVKLAEGLANDRVRKMRSELRQRVGDALRVPDKDRTALDCIESRDAFVVFMPKSQLSREDLADLRPLLRQALVAACAAAETYVADKVMEKIGPFLQSPKAATKFLRDLPMTAGDWLEIEARYQRRRRGLRERIVGPYVREQSSTASNKVGIMLNLIGVADWSKTLDSTQSATKGWTVAFLDRITKRRNRIAHQGDRVGRGRASLNVGEVKTDLASLERIVHAIESVA